MERQDIQDEIDDALMWIDGGFPGTIEGVYESASGELSVTIEGMLTRNQMARIVAILDAAKKKLATEGK